jgi:hypothetical protein
MGEGERNVQLGEEGGGGPGAGGGNVQVVTCRPRVLMKSVENMRLF